MTAASVREVRIHWPDGRSERARLQPLGKSGGAGEVYAIEGRPDLVAKIYHSTFTPAQLAAYERKIRWMMRNRPLLPEVPGASIPVVQLAWPLAWAGVDGRFRGFVMEKIDFERTMEVDYLLLRRQAEAEGFQVDFGKLAAICCNLAGLLATLHARGIAVVDLKPVNLKVYKTELYVAILDCDGFTIHAADFSCDAPQVTPEYLAPEFQGRAVSDPEQQDRFALATIVFRLLNYGIHPYAGISTGRTPAPTELAGRVAAGLYAFARSPLTGIRPPPASVHDCLPDALRALFDRAFLPAPAGRAANRPGAAEWHERLSAYASRAAGLLQPCQHGHLQFTGLPCASCQRGALLSGHIERQRRFVSRLRASPGQARRYVQRTLAGTQPSPFQAQLAQGPAPVARLTHVQLPLRQLAASEITWALCCALTWWWMR